MFLNCLLLDLTVIDIMSIVHVEKIWVEITKNFEMGTSGGGGGGWSVVSDTPGRGGEVKKGQIVADVFYGRPLTIRPPTPQS